jgi:uncharacterized coiled-coil DUF342 family protein
MEKLAKEKQKQCLEQIQKSQQILDQIIKEAQTLQENVRNLKPKNNALIF